MRLPRPLIVVLAVASSMAACAPERALAPTGDGASAPSLVSSRSASRAATGCPAACEHAVARARARLERAAAELTYLSESDYPFVFVSAPRALARREALDEATVRAVFGVAPSEPVESVSLDDFFARHIEQVDPADGMARALVPRYRALKHTVHATTGTTRVYRVGRVAVRCYLVGTDAWGNVIGLATTAIET